MEDNEYECAICHEIFLKIRNNEWNEELARKEYEINFPDSEWDKSIMDVVCADCWQLVRP